LLHCPTNSYSPVLYHPKIMHSPVVPKKGGRRESAPLNRRLWKNPAITAFRARVFGSVGW